MGKRYIMITTTWVASPRCQYVKRTAQLISRGDYVAEVLAVKYGH